MYRTTLSMVFTMPTAYQWFAFVALTFQTYVIYLTDTLLSSHTYVALYNHTNKWLIQHPSREQELLQHVIIIQC